MAIVISIALTVFPSCSTRLSVQKRHFRPGYHVEFSGSSGKSSTWQEPTTNHGRPGAADCTASDVPIEANIQRELKGFVETHEPTSPEESTDAVASIEKVVSLSEGVSNHSSSQEPAGLYGRSNALQVEEQRLSETLSTKSISVNPSPDQKGSQGLKIAGIVLASVGFLLLLFVSWLIGLIVLLLGLGLLIAGLNRPSNNSSSTSQRDNESTWQDVVYLKNGSVIKGMIVEQVPNESIKIQTKDGSIFVYGMGEVAKIAKEQK